MFKFVVALFAVLAVAFAAPQPGVVAPYAYTGGYSAGYVAPAAYSAYSAPVAAAAYAAPAYAGYTGYTGYSAYNPVAYSHYAY